MGAVVLARQRPIRDTNPDLTRAKCILRELVQTGLGKIESQLQWYQYASTHYVSAKFIHVIGFAGPRQTRSLLGESLRPFQHLFTLADVRGCIHL